MGNKLNKKQNSSSLIRIQICIQPKLIILPMVTWQGLHIKKSQVCVRQSSLMNLPFSLCWPLTCVCQSHCSLQFLCKLNQIWLRVSSRGFNNFRAALVVYADIISAFQSSAMCVCARASTHVLSLTTYIISKVSGKPMPAEVIYHLDYRLQHFT